MTNNFKTTNRINYLLNKKLVKNIKKGLGKYSVHDMKTDLKEIRAFLKDRGFYKEANLIYEIVGRIARLDVYKEYVLDKLEIINEIVCKIQEKEKVMNIRELLEYRDHVSYVSRMARKKQDGEAIEKYDVLYIPTQGGFHYSVVYDLLDNGMALCYPITTSSGRDLKMLGNSWYTLRNCGCSEYNGQNLSSAVAYVDLKRASYCKQTHISNYIEIEMAVANF